MIRGQSSNHLGHPLNGIGKILEPQIGEEAERQEFILPSLENDIQTL